MSPAIYNEIEPFAARWLGNLAGAGLIADGRVDERSIEDLAPEDIAGAEQFHAFAGIGVWSHALRLAGVPDSAPVWTGSCPCQPFSVAGKRRGVDDHRHLWPAWFALIRECRPPIVFGEQVASPDGRAWLDAVSDDLEGVGYAVGSADLCAASVGAPHIRQRLLFVAHAGGEGLEGWAQQPTQEERETAKRGSNALGACAVGKSSGEGSRGNTGAVPGEEAQGQGKGSEARRVVDEPEHAGSACLGAVAYADHQGRSARKLSVRPRRPRQGPIVEHRDGEVDAGATRGFWSVADWLPCQDGRLRAVEPGTFPLAHGSPARVGRLRAYGNAIVPQVAATFVRAALESIQPQEEP